MLGALVTVAASIGAVVLVVSSIRALLRKIGVTFGDTVEKGEGK